VNYCQPSLCDVYLRSDLDVFSLILSKVVIFFWRFLEIIDLRHVIINFVLVETSRMISKKIVECEDNGEFTWVELAIASSYQSYGDWECGSK
jgi:hypothetical protein